MSFYMRFSEKGSGTKNVSWSLNQNLHSILKWEMRQIFTWKNIIRNIRQCCIRENAFCRRSVLKTVNGGVRLPWKEEVTEVFIRQNNLTTCPDLNGRILIYAYMPDIMINMIHFYSQKCFDLNDHYMFVLAWEPMGKCGLDGKVELK